MKWQVWLTGVLVVLLSGCGGDTPAAGLNEQEQEQELRSWLDNRTTDVPFTLLLASQSGAQFRHSTGNSTADTQYESASTSKLVTAVVILDLVEDGVLSLSDHPQDHISGWPETGLLAEITLQQLLNFTSGLTEEPLCQNFPNAGFANCVLRIAELNDNPPTPGTEYHYGSPHLQVAGLMALNAAIAAGRLDAGSGWGDLFADFKTTYGLFSASAYDLPSANNPRLAGGMHWTGTDMMAFLQALATGAILETKTWEDMRTALAAEVDITSSPAADLNLSWGYGYGLWLETCTGTHTGCVSSRISSPGAYGAYPFIDVERQYWGLLARQGALGTFNKGYELMNAARPLLDNWAALAAD